METFELNAEKREDVGKGASRRLRRDGKVPGIVYGADKDATMITLGQNDVLHHLEYEAFYSHILTLNVGKETEQVVLKDLQRHPFKRLLMHIDFLRVKAGEKLSMRVPLHFLNEEKCIGVKRDGGAINHLMSDLEIECLPKDLPEYIEVDMLNVALGDTIHIQDLTLPQGVEVYALAHGVDEELGVATVYMPRIVTEPEEDEEEEISPEVEATKQKESDDSED
ncbi:MAG: 50S ribosomal protein L25/general stress protein Ctc [Gammaproteobacteria bacterium]